MHLIGFRFGHITIGRRQCLLNLLTTAVAAVSLSANEGTLISDTHYELLSNYCLNCHDEVEMKGEVNLDHYSIDWGREAERDLWENALHMIQEGLMPPEDEDQPSPEERETLIAWLDEKLLEHTPSVRPASTPECCRVSRHHSGPVRSAGF